MSNWIYRARLARLRREMPELSICRCATRQSAQRTGFFEYSKHLGGWFFPDDVRRVRVLREQSWKNGKGHDGEPYVWTCCPFCGGDLGES